MRRFRVKVNGVFFFFFKTKGKKQKKISLWPEVPEPLRCVPDCYSILIRVVFFMVRGTDTSVVSDLSMYLQVPNKTLDTTCLTYRYIHVEIGYIDTRYSIYKVPAGMYKYINARNYLFSHSNAVLGLKRVFPRASGCGGRVVAPPVPRCTSAPRPSAMARALDD